MVFDWLILRIPGWGRRIRRLRRDWDRARERALTKDGPLRRLILRKLDDVEAHLKILEEQQNIGRMDKKRFAREIKIVLSEVEVLLKTNSDDFAASQASHRARKA